MLSIDFAETFDMFVWPNSDNATVALHNMVHSAVCWFFFQTSKLSASRTWTLGSSFALELRSHQDQENPDLLGEGGILQSCGFREVAAEHGLVIIPNKPTIKTAPWFRCNIKPPNNQTFRTPLTAPMIWQLWQSSPRNQGLEQGGQYHEISTGRGKGVSALEDV